MVPAGGEGQKKSRAGGGVGGPAWHLDGTPGGTDRYRRRAGCRTKTSWLFLPQNHCSPAKAFWPALPPSETAALTGLYEPLFPKLSTYSVLAVKGRVRKKQSHVLEDITVSLGKERATKLPTGKLEPNRIHGIKCCQNREAGRGTQDFLAGP